MASPGERFGRYTLVRRLPPRGPGELWAARGDDPDAPEVALCITALTRRDEAEAERRLRRNLEVARLIRHENMVHVLDGGHARGLRYVVTERVDGVELSRILAAARAGGSWPSFGVAGFVVHEVARALEYLHAFRTPFGEALGLAHREISPRSVIIERSGAVKLADMLTGGEAQSLVETAGRGQSGVFAYVSPELAANGRIDARSDIFALGVVLWELLTQRPLFLRTTDLETLAAVRAAEIPSTPAECPPDLAHIAKRCLLRTPEERPAAEDLVRDLARVVISFPDAGPSAARALAEATIERERAAGASAGEVDAGSAETIVPGVERKRTAILPDAAPPAEDDTTEPPSETKAERRHVTMKSDPPSAAAAAHPETPDPFYDPSRDVQRWGNRFEVLARLGSGGMGEVYRVRDKELDEVVAIKLIPRESTTELRSTERLKREVRLARRISSPYVCRIFDIVDLGEGVRGLTMAYIEGTTLAELMRTGLYVDYQRIARWGAEMAEGLAAAHDLQIIHRDLKPENVMIRSDDRAVILDFGIAADADTVNPSIRLTQQGMIMGTPLYMSPEQLVASQLDGRSDLFALGLILAELITGEVPMRGATYQELLEKRVTKIEPYWVRHVDPGVPELLATTIDELLHPAAADRPSSALEVAARLRMLVGRATDRYSIAAPPAPPPQHEPRPLVEEAPPVLARPSGLHPPGATYPLSGPSSLLSDGAPVAPPPPPITGQSEVLAIDERPGPSPVMRAAMIVLGTTAVILLVIGLWVVRLRQERAELREEPLQEVHAVGLDAGRAAAGAAGQVGEAARGTPDASATPTIEPYDAGPKAAPARDANPQPVIPPVEAM